MPKLLTLKNNVALITDDIEAWYSHFLYERFMLPSHLPCDIKIASDSCPWLPQCENCWNLLSPIFCKNYVKSKHYCSITLYCALTKCFPIESKFHVFYSVASQSLEQNPSETAKLQTIFDEVRLFSCKNVSAAMIFLAKVFARTEIAIELGQKTVVWSMQLQNI